MRGLLIALLLLIGSASYADRINIYLSEEISSDQSSYLPVFKEIERARAKDTIVLKLSGYGGDSNTLLRLFYLLDRSPAHVIVDVQGDVYSAHAMLALVGEEIVINPDSTFIFHQVSSLNSELSVCKDELFKMDRGVWAYTKCLTMVRETNIKYKIFFEKHIFPYLTATEISMIQSGYEVYVSGEEMGRRISKIKTTREYNNNEIFSNWNSSFIK